MRLRPGINPLKATNLCTGNVMRCLVQEDAFITGSFTAAGKATHRIVGTGGKGSIEGEVA